MKRILFLSPNLGINGGGAERQIVNVACGLKQKGYFVEFLCYFEGDFYENNLKDNDITVYRKLLPNYIKRSFYVRRFIRKNKYDVVISFLETPNFLNCFSAIGGKSWKVIIGERSAIDESFKAIKLKIYCSLQRFADLLVANSENAVNLRVAQFPYLKTKTKVIYNRIVINDTELEYIPKKDGKLNVLILASYQYLKNSIGLIEAVNAMSEEEKNKFNINWYGNIRVTSDCYEQSVSKVKEYNLENILHFNEHTDKVYEKIKQSDVVALFSRIEGLPNAICEGMVMGKPIIMSRVSDYATLVDESNGFLCDWNNAESIKTSLLQMASLSEEELIEKGRNSKKKADLLFSEEIVANHWVEAIESR